MEQTTENKIGFVVIEKRESQTNNICIALSEQAACKIIATKAKEMAEQMATSEDEAFAKFKIFDGRLSMKYFSLRNYEISYESVSIFQ